MIDTRPVPPQDRLEFWADSSREMYHPLHISRDAKATGEFEAQMWGERLASIGLFRVAAAQNTMSRTQRDIAMADPECLHVSVLLRGRLYGEQQTRSCSLGPGDITTYDTSAPAVFRAPDGFDLLVLRLPKVTLGRDAERIARLTGLRIPGHRGLPRLAVQFFRGVEVGLTDGTIDTEDSDIAEQIIHLVHRLYLDLGGSPSRHRGVDAEPHAHARAFISANLSDPALNPASIARACFVSTRYLHQLFTAGGISVGDYIRSERLDRCRRDLLDPSLAHEPVAGIGSCWGLQNASHFSRVFREAYGRSPREFRRDAHGAAADAPSERS